MPSDKLLVEPADLHEVVCNLRNDGPYDEHLKFLMINYMYIFFIYVFKCYVISW